MLSLREIVKTYVSGDAKVHALRGVSIDFRENEFVSILGPSGCGKTTLLNVIGGLDRYDDGDLVINERSTREYRDADWDTYRNHSIGFVFQSYNLISHQTVLANVELALTLSGVSREERRRRAIEALEQVGLGDQIHKKPNQMSGGQMQRVAIARALVNNPDILLADEPTGALDTATSVQIMEIIKKVAEKKLVIMVTHNPELAEQYSTRIIRLKDGNVIDDTDPYTPYAQESAALAFDPNAPVVCDPCEVQPAPKPAKKRKDGKGKRSMSFLTALSLSLTNLMTKKTRTLLVSIAGSIGIIGIALILALSNGVNLFIASVQEDTLSSYPISITAEASNLDAMLSAMVGTKKDEKYADRELNKVYVDDSISNMVSAMVTKDKNNLPKFNDYLLSRYNEIKDDIMAIQYSYSMNLQIFNGNSLYGDKGLMQVSPSGILSEFADEYSGLSQITENISIFSEIMPGRDGELINPAIYEQYTLVDGNWPQNETELLLVVDKYSTVSNITLYMLGMLNPDDMTAMMAAMMTGEKYEANTEGMEFSFTDFYDLDLFLAYNSDFYEKTGASYYVGDTELPLWSDKRDSDGFEAGSLREQGLNLKIVGVVRPSDNATATSISGSVAYTSALTDKVLEKINSSEIVEQQKTYGTHDVFTGLPFEIEDADKLTDAQKIEKLESYFGKLNPAEKVTAYMAIRTEVTEEDMYGKDGKGGYMAAIKEIINTPEKQQQFLIDLFGFNSGYGSLAYGSTANEAVAAILLAADMVSDDYLEMLGVTDVNDREQVLEAYKKLVPTFATGFSLDGIPLLPDDGNPETAENSSAYATYKGLISAMYNTEEKMTRAFEDMTETTFKMVYSMVETNNVSTEIKEITAPHFSAFLNGEGESVSVMTQRTYVLEKLFLANGLTGTTDSLAMSLMQYVYNMSEDALAQKYYTLRIDNDEDFKNAAIAALFDDYRADMIANDAETYAALYENHMQKSESTLDDTLILIGANVDNKALTSINIYPVDFEAKERLAKIIDDYNAQEGLAEEDQISYTDIMAILMDSVTTIIDAITYVLVAFVSISLVVSSIMIGIITYISVLERTKEIGILRAIGASKRDISRVFNAETLIIGFAAGAIGILTTLLFCIPINLIIESVSGMSNIKAVLPVSAAFILIGISMALTLIAGLIPSKIASKKDPVEALRSE